MALPCDLGSVLLDGRQHWFVAHLVGRRSWWRGRIFAAMNAQFLGRFDVAPRGHPNDGLVELLDVDPALGLSDRVKAWRRLPTGTHGPIRPSPCGQGTGPTGAFDRRSPSGSTAWPWDRYTPQPTVEPDARWCC
jgi:hypothetical protein